MSSLTNPGKVEEFIDGYSAQQIFSSKHRRSGVTFGDCIILPGEITFGIDQLNLATKLTKNITLNLPFVSSPMDTVTEHQMATAMALQGGLGIIHCNFSIEDQVDQINRVKRYKNGFILDPLCCGPEATLLDLDEIAEKQGITGIPVTSTGKVGGQLLGIITSRDSDFVVDRSTKAVSIMTPRSELTTSTENCTLEEANKMMQESRKGKLPIVDGDGNLYALIARADLLKQRDFPHATKSSKDGSLMVGAAVSVRVEDRPRVDALVKAGVDVIIVDSKQGDSREQIDMIQYIKSTHGDAVDVIGGNAVTVSQIRHLIEAGVDGIRVGMGAATISTVSVCLGCLGGGYLGGGWLGGGCSGGGVVSGGGCLGGGCLGGGCLGGGCLGGGCLVLGSKDTTWQFVG
jgi:IMP dehydrogenase